MRNANFKVLAAIVLAVFMVSGCGLSKMVKKYNTVKFKATPEVLETHGGKISVTVEGTIPAKYFHKKAIVEFTPVLKYGGSETKLKTITLQGEKAAGTGQKVGYKSGTSFSYTDVFDYNPAMNASELKVNPKASLKKKTVNLGEVKLADGVIYTSERVERDQDVEIADHNYELETIASEAANLFFEYNNSKLNPNLTLNKDQANKDKITALENFLKKNWQIKTIDILAWASPEGELSINQKLADERGKVGNTYMIEKLKKMINDKVINLLKPEDAKLNVIPKGEDNDGFMKALNASNIPQKQTIANVINSQDDKMDREKTIKDMTVIYSEIETMLSVLRRDEMKVYCYEPKKTKQEIIQLSTTAPDKLDNKELLYSATLTDDWKVKYQIYKSATTIYPQDWRNFCNAGGAAMAVGKLDEAASYLDKANTLKKDDPKVAYNLGVLATWNKNFESAAAYFVTAKKGNIDCSYAEGVIKIRKGDYSGALSSFGSKKCKYNIALAQLLNGAPADALKTLDCTKPQTAAVYYLMAVAGVHSANTSVMYDNLKKAIQADSKYRDQAKEDREFLKYFTESGFLDAVK